MGRWGHSFLETPMNAPYPPNPPHYAPNQPPPHYPYAAPPPRPRISPWVWVLLGVMLLGLGTCGGVVALVVVGSQAEPGGVLLGGAIPDAKRVKLLERGIVHEGDKLIAFYDGSLSLDMSEVSVLTADQLVYAKGRRVTRMPLRSIVSIDHRVEGIIGDVIEVAAESGERLRIEVAHLNDGVSFLNALEDEARKKHPAVTVRRQTPR